MVWIIAACKTGRVASPEVCQAVCFSDTLAIDPLQNRWSISFQFGASVKKRQILPQNYGVNDSLLEQKNSMISTLNDSK